jgi:hypothetical protein
MKLILENWNKFLNESIDSSIGLVSSYLGGIERIIQMGYEKAAPRRRLKQHPPFGPRTVPDEPKYPPGQWAQKTGSTLIKQIDRISRVMVSAEYGTEFATFEPMIRKLGEDLISIGKSNPTSQELEGQLQQMGDQVTSLRKMTSQIMDRGAVLSPEDR